MLGSLDSLTREAKKPDVRQCSSEAGEDTEEHVGGGGGWLQLTQRT